MNSYKYQSQVCYASGSSSTAKDEEINHQSRHIRADALILLKKKMHTKMKIRQRNECQDQRIEKDQYILKDNLYTQAYQEEPEELYLLPDRSQPIRLVKPTSTDSFRKKETESRGYNQEESQQEQGTIEAAAYELLDKQELLKQGEVVTMTPLQFERQKLSMIKTSNIQRSTAAIEATTTTIKTTTITRKTFKKLVAKWFCTKCQHECIPIREESRCLCGHRYKEHPSSADDMRVKDKSNFKAFSCTSAKCPCKRFFYVVAEGAWVLRCRCKHKHIDHDPGSKPFNCKKPKCSCTGFDSPWVCNCDHAWSDHQQEFIEKEFTPLSQLQEQFQVEELNQVHRTDLLQNPITGIL